MDLQARPPARGLLAPVMTAATLLVVCVAAATARGAGNAGEQAPDFPPGEFTDGGRYSLEELRGKAVVLYFYEKL